MHLRWFSAKHAIGHAQWRSSECVQRSIVRTAALMSGQRNSRNIVRNQ